MSAYVVAEGTKANGDLERRLIAEETLADLVADGEAETQIEALTLCFVPTTTDISILGHFNIVPLKGSNEAVLSPCYMEE